MLRNRITTVLDPGLSASYRTRLNTRIEIKYQFYISVWLIKEFLRYIIELCEWASKADLTWAKRENPKREKILPLCGHIMILVCL